MNPTRTNQSNTVNNCPTNVPDSIHARTETDTSHFAKFKRCKGTKLEPERKEITNSFQSVTKLNLKGLPIKWVDVADIDHPEGKRSVTEAGKLIIPPNKQTKTWGPE